MRCYVCGRKSSVTTCAGCWTRGLAILKDLPSEYTALESVLIPSKGYGEKVQGTRTPPIPARLDVLHLRTGGITQVLYKHESSIRVELRHSTITFAGNEYQKIEKSVTYLSSQWEWVEKNYESGSDLLVDLVGLSREIQNALGNKSEDITIGTCPALDDEGNTCGAILRISPKVMETLGDIRCPLCATVWESRKWRLLGQIIEQSKNNYYVESSGSPIQSVSENHSTLGAGR
jgi:hypothetical protein